MEGISNCLANSIKEDFCFYKARARKWVHCCAPDLDLVPTILFEAKKIENWKNADHFLSSKDQKFANAAGLLSKNQDLWLQ